MLTEETKRRIQNCRDYLVGKLPLPTDQVELITLTLIYKFMDDLDEESVNLGGKRSFFTGELAPYRWRALLPQSVSAEERMRLFARGLELLGGAEMEVEVEVEGKTEKQRIVPAAHLPLLFRDVFRNSFLKFRDGRILTLLLTEVNGFAYTHSEELGNAFEFLLQSMGTQGENGQFRTPRHIIDFVVACLDPKPGDKILDPACGTGGFLVSAFKHILATHTTPGSTVAGDRLKHAERQSLYGNLTGYDITDFMVKLSKVNLFLHDFTDPAIHIYDTLTNDARWHEKADLILANPPFMTPKGGVTPHTKFRIAAKKAEVLFTDYIAEHLTPDGRAGIIVPNGIVATTQNAYVKLRRFLVEDSLVAVISLPSGVFKPYSGVKTSILLLDKKLARQTKEVLFLKITADGFDLGDKRNPIEANDLPEAERVAKAWLNGTLNDECRMTDGKGIVWRTIEKKALLENRSVNLQAEAFVGGEVAGTDCSMVSFEDLCVRMQYGLSVPLNTDGIGTPCFRMNEIPGGVATDRGAMKRADISAEDLSKYRLNRGDLLFNRTNSFEHVGRTGIFDLAGDYVFASYLIRLEIKRELADPRYINAFMNSSRFQEGIKSRASRAVNQANISASALAGYEIPLPPLEEQQRIVAEIEGYQKVLDGARQILAGYRPRLDISPEWETVRLEDVCEIKRGRFSHRPRNAPQFYGGKYPFLQTGDVVRANGGAVSHTQTLNELGLKVSKLFQPPIVLITIAANIGDTALLTYSACFTDSVVGLTPTERILPQFLEFAMRGKKEYLNALAPQAAQKNITVEVLREVEIPLPPLEEQRRIVAELDAEAAQMEAVRGLIPRFEAKIQRVLDRVWGREAVSE